MHKAAVLFFSSFLTLALTVSIMMEPSFVSASIPKPSVPQFSVNFIDTSYNTPPTTTTDPYTGKTIIQESSHVEARAIEIRIKNEPFSPFAVQDESSNNWTVEYLYNIRWKGHFEHVWTEVSYPADGYIGRSSGFETVFLIGGEYSPSAGLNLSTRGWPSSFPVGSQIDIQVEAMIGYIHRMIVEGGMVPWVFTGEKSGWSGTQTLTIGEPTQTAVPSASQSSTSPNANPTVSQVFGLDWSRVAVVVLLGMVVVLLVFVVFYLRKRR